MTTSPQDQGSQSLEFALISPLIAGAIALVIVAGAMANAAITTAGMAQTLARQIALNGAIDPPATYAIRVDPSNPAEGASFHVTLERPVVLPLPGKPVWTIRQEAWGIRAPKADP